MRHQLTAIPSQRKSKIQLTCRLSAQKLHANKQNLIATPPKHTGSIIQLQNYRAYDSPKNNSLSPGLSLKCVLKPDLNKKIKRRQSVLQIDIDCIEDEYNKKKVVNQDTPLFANVVKATTNVIRNRRDSKDSAKTQNLHGAKEQGSFDVREKHESVETRPTEDGGLRDKYSYDHLINAIKINYRHEGSIEKQTRQKILPILIKETSQQKLHVSHHVLKKQQSLYNTNQTTKDTRIIQPPRMKQKENSEAAMDQLSKVRDQINKLRDILKINAKVCQMVFLIDDLQRQLIDKQQKSQKIQQKVERQSKPYRQQLKQTIIRESYSEAVQIQNSRYFQSIHNQQYDSKQQLNSSKNFKKFNTQSEEMKNHHEAQMRNTNTKSPFRQIMNYMNRRR